MEKVIIQGCNLYFIRVKRKMASQIIIWEVGEEHTAKVWSDFSGGRRILITNLNMIFLFLPYMQCFKERN
jgi:hypothetical protein